MKYKSLNTVTINAELSNRESCFDPYSCNYIGTFIFLVLITSLATLTPLGVS